MVNEKQKQTYYGALDYRTGKVIVKGAPKGNTENTIKLIKYLQQQYRSLKIVIIWDGASYHHSQGFREDLEDVNQEKTKEEWLITCIRLAPHAPEQNPIEEVWLQGKEFLRKSWHFCKNFKVVKWLFEWSISQDTFCFSKLSIYGSFSSITYDCYILLLKSLSSKSSGVRLHI